MTAQTALTIVPLTLAEANRLVEQLHRHHAPAWGHRWSIGVQIGGGGLLVGVAIAGRPVARMLDDGMTIEVTRVATDGTPNACSALYGAMKRIAREMGYQRILTYTLATEPGTSLRAAGWTRTAIATRGRNWNMPGRPRQAHEHNAIPKVRWECLLVPVAKRMRPSRPEFGKETA
ncbi:MAG: hypothetical protein JWO59_699 [Chloroflexi bacterium]|nr:hypothetical protein [Chloroflexota bacterium]